MDFKIQYKEMCTNVVHRIGGVNEKLGTPIRNGLMIVNCL